MGRHLRACLAMLVLLAASLGVSIGSTAALSSDTEIFFDNFESGSLSNWQVVTRVNGTAKVETVVGPSKSQTQAARITVPDYNVGSMAYIKKTLPSPVYALSAEGNFNVLSGGCDKSAGYSQGSVPFLRFFDANGKRVAGLYRINSGNCGGNTKLYVQHSGNYYRTGQNVALEQWNRFELRITVSTPTQSLVQVYANGRKIYESLTADNGTVPITSVNLHNEHHNQVGDLLADNIRLATFPSTPPSANPCDPTTALPGSDDPGTTLLADGFESYDFSKWSQVTIGGAHGEQGDGTATIQTDIVKSGKCALLLHVTSSSGSRANISKTLPSGTAEVWTTGWFNVQREGSNVPFFRVFTGSSRIVDVYRVNGSGAFYLRTPNGSGSWTYTKLNRTLSLNTWYQVKVHAIANGNTSTVEVWLDGTNVLTTTTATLGVTSFGNVMVGSEHFAQEGDLAADDIVIKTVP